MKLLLAMAVFAAIATSAAAKPSPFKPEAAAPAFDDESVLYLGPVGAMLESDYFRVPQPPAGAGRVFPCRTRLHAIGGKPGFTQACD